MCRHIHYSHSFCGHEYLECREYCSAAPIIDPEFPPSTRQQVACENVDIVYADVLSSHSCTTCKDREEELEEERWREEQEWNACAEDNDIDSLENINIDSPKDTNIDSLGGANINPHG